MKQSRMNSTWKHARKQIHDETQQKRPGSSAVPSGNAAVPPGNAASPEGFSLAMALTDCLPVLFFCIGSAVLAFRFASLWFRAGIFLVILAGVLKAGWKLAIALTGKNLPLLNRQMRFLMPAGFFLMLLALLADRERWSPSAVLRHMTSPPSLVFFLAGAAGILRLFYLARRLDGRDAKANWNEQITNGITQLCILLGILF